MYNIIINSITINASTEHSLSLDSSDPCDIRMCRGGYWAHDLHPATDQWPKVSPTCLQEKSRGAAVEIQHAAHQRSGKFAALPAASAQLLTKTTVLTHSLTLPKTNATLILVCLSHQNEKLSRILQLNLQKVDYPSGILQLRRDRFHDPSDEIHSQIMRNIDGLETVCALRTVGSQVKVPFGAIWLAMLLRAMDISAWPINPRSHTRGRDHSPIPKKRIAGLFQYFPNSATSCTMTCGVWDNGCLKDSSSTDGCRESEVCP